MMPTRTNAAFSANSSAANEVAIEFRNVGFAIQKNQILSDVNLQVAAGETLVLLGRSGSGKSTALKLINRLLAPSQGEVRVSGRATLAWDAIALRRGIGYVIQETGLFPHFTVEKNVALVPRLENWPEDRVRQRVDELLQLVGLTEPELAKRYPHQLSGGQRQRVGVARALAADPPILLMDEPFGALDPLTRSEIQREFQQLQKRLSKTVVFVTHDVREAILLATRIGLFENGQVMGIYSPAEFLESRDPKISTYLASIRPEPAPTKAWDGVRGEVK
ncbi:MAG: ATP-binding cassette domain-containing protein [Candidatus Acidiferrales bacterium]